MKRTSIEFTEPNIKRLFGTYDGEGENSERLKEYYLKTSTYRQIKADVPISILVGHKGIGKSSLF